MKKFLVCLLALLSLLALAGGIGLYWLNNGYLEKKIAELGKTYVGAPLQCQSASIKLFPPEALLKKVDWQTEHFELSANTVLLEPDFWELLGASPRIKNLSLQNPVLKIRNLPKSDMADDSQNGATRAQSGLLPFELDRLLIQKGKFSIATSEDEYIFSNVNISAQNLGRKQEADIKCDFYLEESGKTGMIAGDWAFQGKMRFFSPNLVINKSSATFTPMGKWPKWAKPLQFNFEGAINIHSLMAKINLGGISAPSAQLACNGSLDLKKLAFDGVARLEIFSQKLAQPPQGPPLVISGGCSYENGQAAINDMAINFGLANGGGELKIQLPPYFPEMRFTGKIWLDAINLSELGEFSPNDSKDKAAEKADEPVTEKSDTHWPIIALDAHVGETSWHKLKANKINFSLTGQSGIYKIEPLTCEWAGGNANSVLLLNFLSNEFDLELDLKDVELGEVLSEFGMEEFKGGKTNAKAKFSSNGLKLEDIKSSLAGGGELRTNDLKISGLEEIALIFNLFGKEQGVFPDTVDTLTAKFSAQKGLIDFVPLELRAKSLHAHGHALVNLPAYNIDGRIYLQFLGLDMPLVIKGPLDHISFDVAPGFMHGLEKDLPW